ncbi:MAG: SBBP repeat-containing protein [candidate division WOR-3 bacterium]
MRAGEQRIKIVFALLLPFGLFSCIFAQVWIRTYDGPANWWDKAYAITLDPSGNVVVTGYVSISHNGDTIPNYCTIKYGADGALEWIRFFDGGFGLAITTDADGNVYVTGVKVTIKYYSDGSVAWVRTYGKGFWGSDIAVDPQGNVYVTGYIDAPILYYATTIKYNARGDEEWVRIDSSGISWTVSIALDTAGNVYVAGIGTHRPGEPAYLVMKYSPDGDLLWRVCDEQLGGGIYKLGLTVTDDIYVTGSLNDINGPYTVATVKYNADGEQQWVRFFDGPGYDEGQTLAVDPYGNCYVAIGSAERPGPVTNFDWVIIKYAADGTELWQQRYTGMGADDNPFAIGIDRARNVYVGGFSMSPRDSIYWGDDYTLVKYDSLGNLVWEARYPGPDNLYGWIYDLVIDSADYIYTTGFVTTGTMSNFDFDWCTIKWAPAGPGVAEPGIAGIKQGQITLYPSPAKSYFQLSGQTGLKAVRLYDIAGKLVRVYQPVNAGSRFSLERIPAGVYLVKLQTPDREITRKLVVR